MNISYRSDSLRLGMRLGHQAEAVCVGSHGGWRATCQHTGLFVARHRRLGSVVMAPICDRRVGYVPRRRHSESAPVQSRPAEIGRRSCPGGSIANPPAARTRYGNCPLLTAAGSPHLPPLPGPAPVEGYLRSADALCLDPMSRPRPGLPLLVVPAICRRKLSRLRAIPTRN